MNLLKKENIQFEQKNKGFFGYFKRQMSMRSPEDLYSFIVLAMILASFMLCFPFAIFLRYIFTHLSINLSYGSVIAILSMIGFPALFCVALNSTKKRVKAKTIKGFVEAEKIMIAEIKNMNSALQIKNGARSAVLLAQLQMWQQEVRLHNRYYAMNELQKVIGEEISYLEKINQSERNDYYIAGIYMSEGDIQEVLSHEQISAQWIVSNLSVGYEPVRRNLHYLAVERLVGVPRSEPFILAKKELTDSEFAMLEASTQQKITQHLYH